MLQRLTATARRVARARDAITYQLFLAGEEIDAPFAECPKCGTPNEDFDGFGVLCCRYCDYCAHASIDTGGDGKPVCNFCRRVLERTQVGPHQVQYSVKGFAARAER